MKKKKKASRKLNHPSRSAAETLTFYTDLSQLKRQLEKLSGNQTKLEERMQDMEIHVNLLTRLLTTLCIEKFGMRVGVLKRLIKRIEKEAIRDSQILHLESLYKLPLHPEKKSQNNQGGTSAKNDPWEEIS
ncbi:MAG: hypothetical protein HYZ84_01110 [Candidatus Omnitrophica bacterium]|nr:hypothetical protein [Candidatus Omnitrophota bacterium]